MEKSIKSENHKADSAKITTEFNIEDVFQQYTQKFGRFQRLLFFYIVIFIAPLMSFNTTTQFLMFLVPPHTCPHKVTTNFTADPVHDLSDMELPNATFDLSYFYSTVVSENLWVCESDWKAMWPHTLYRFGSFGGILVVGTVADRFGRIPVIVVCFLMAGIAGLMSIFTVRHVGLFLFCRFIMGFVTMKGYVAVILVTEYFGSSYRSYPSNGMLFMIAITTAFLPWLALFLNDWRTLTAITSAAMFVAPIVTLMIPESVRWLISRGRSRKAHKMIKYMAKINKKALDLVPAHFSDRDERKVVSVSFTVVLNHRKFLQNFVFTSIIWLFIQMISYGGNLYAAVLTENPFFQLTMNAILDLLATLASQILANCFGRKKTVIGACIIMGLTYGSTVLIPADAKYQKQILLCLLACGRFVVTICYNIKFLYGAEICPTIIRVRALSVRMSIGSLGSLLIPSLLTFKTFGRNTPLLVFGIIGLLAALPMCFLPETLNQPLPETLEDADNFGCPKMVAKKAQINPCFEP